MQQISSPANAPATASEFPLIPVVAGGGAFLLLVAGLLVVRRRTTGKQPANFKRHASEADVNDMYSVDVPRKSSKADNPANVKAGIDGDVEYENATL